MAESGGAEGIRANRRLKTPGKEDRLSALPDSLIQHILSFLPSTKQAIQTAILSKRWHNQWTFVSNLLFDFSNMFSDYSPKSAPVYTGVISAIIDHTLFLHQCSKIHKFQIKTDYSYYHEYDPNSEVKIRFVVRKQVEELILKFSYQPPFRLPEFFFDQPFLVKLKLSGCCVMPKGMVNWKSLKDLSLKDCSCPCEVITSIVSGSPLLQSLELKCRLSGPVKLIIASKSLKRLFVYKPGCYVEISCPNLVDFEGHSTPRPYQNFGWCDNVLEKLLSDSPKLESLKLLYFEFSKARIASMVLKKFVFKGRISNEIAISCPHLEELSLSGMLETLRLMNLPSSVCAFLDFDYHEGGKATGVKHILESVRHLNELKFGNKFLESLSALEKDLISNPLLKRKSLTLEGSYFHSVVGNPGILYALRCMPVLERLVVKLQPCKLLRYVDPSDMDHSEENFWNSDGARLSSLVPHLRAVKITGFSQRELRPKRVLGFVEFLLKHATVLEKMVIVLEDCGTDFVIKVSQKLLSFPRYSAAIVELSLSALEMDVKLHLSLKHKSLTLEGSYGASVVDIPGIANALCCSPVLERLAVKLQPCKNRRHVDLSDLDHPKENYWHSNWTHLSSLVSHLGTVDIIGFSQRQDNPKLVIDLVEFLLKNAIVLEKMVVVLEDSGTDFVIKVSQKLSSFPRCSASIVEMVCP